MSPLKGFRNLETGGIVFKRSSIAGEAMEVACGQCLGCRLDHTRTWACRIVHEAQMWPRNCFITLTYRPKENCTSEQLAKGQHIPDDGSLNKKHFQDFMKRLRKHFQGVRIRYYHCGEYGDQLDRPHYHACLFNLDFADKELYKNNNGYPLFISQTLEKLWGYGFATVGALTFETAAYCARYCTKKITGVRAQDHYLRCDEYGVAYWLQPEYTTMSRRPGVGRTWYDEFKGDLFPGDEVPVPGTGVFKKVPRYYEQILASEDADAHAQLKQLRRAFREAHGEDYTPQRLESKYKILKAQQQQKTRSYEDAT